MPRKPNPEQQAVVIRFLKAEHTALKAFCLRRKRSMNTVVRDAVAEYLEREDPKRSKVFKGGDS